MSGTPTVADLVAVIRNALDFANRAAGEGIEIDGLSPEDFLMEYCNATGDTDWETIPDRIGEQITRALSPAATEPVAWWDISEAPRDGSSIIATDGELTFKTYLAKHYVKWPHEEGGPTFREVWHYEDSSSVVPWNPTMWTTAPGAAAPPSPVTVEAAVAAARELIDGAQTTYRARNGRQMSLEADDGERCYIVHSDLVFALTAALRALAGEKRDG